MEKKYKPLALLIEDEEDIREILENYLKNAGFDCEGVGTLADSKNKILTTRYDLIVIDLNLPDGRAEEMIESIRSQPRQPNFRTPILVESGDFNKATLIKLGNKIQGAIVKPFDSMKVRATLKEFFSKLS